MRRLAAVVVSTMVLAGCTATAEEPETPSPFAACPAAVSEKSDLPDLSLPCFTGGQEIDLSGLPAPAVINLWASWCGPCREELPVIQGLADRTAGELTVVGVDVGDRRDAAASFATDFNVNFPTFYDSGQKLLAALGQSTLPVTVFVSPEGKTHVHRGTALDVPTLIGLVQEHTGVTVRQ
ncbi:MULTISPECIES: TlpA disulfide reductase family protein [Actinoplanes]|uniref:TlpA family protein disulfide reductase n=1 Tax=Actinoplanes TaxID=1865 RepID=UPI00069748B0|nr:MULTISPECIES: TlpA disulfide reductase family protein [Actinoplanes]GLY05214.1 membrane protein [Actinoplanes sp. NBRC 101535]